MALTSSLRDRRLANRQIELKQQFVVFWLRQAWFAIPINSMHRAISLETDIPVITQAGIEVPIIDIGAVIFSNHQPILSSNTLKSKNLQFGSVEVSAQRSLILVHVSGQVSAQVLDLNHLLDRGKSLVGISIDSQPVLQRMLDSEFVPLPNNYRTDFNSELIRVMSPASLEDANRPEIFLLNPDAIAQPKI
jgi:hypothetical protein